ncbi:S-adenosyl-L-methionine-dependent methyltransferase [Mycena pura]|uniref:S-adenosyl-L-methionine-dependent methyltransferase n=1 Tax=Mycena pura TaxID=153505 RepID=A0AAD6VMM1_9AGAR|nr:S-adenosyl-L-methionine-dependent methyltransferase [Mycena pura]
MKPESGLDEIVALADLISRTVEDVVAEYAAAGVSMPSLASTTPGPFDTPESVPPKLAKATRILDAACAQLSFSVGNPGHVITNKCYGFQEPACMLVVTDAKIADLLLNKPNGVHIDELSRKTGIDAGKLGRVLRLLSTKHCFAEIKPDVFANNRLSMKLLSTDPVSSLAGHITDEPGKACTALSETLNDPETTASMLPQKSAFRRAHGCTIFEFYGSVRSFRRFNQAMIGWGDVTGKGMLPKVYPWGSLPADTIVCDVGGGNGHATVDLLNAFPHLKIIVQDLPPVVEEGRQIFQKNTEMSSTLKQHVQYIPFDFFKESPVKGCDVYYIRHVLHDWPAEECKKILDNIRKVVKPSSRVFIHEFVLQHISHDSGLEGKFEKAPEPLLPNFGVGRVRPYAQDINMMVCLNSQERTLPGFIQLGALSGFEFVKLWDLGEVDLIEFKPKA